MNGRTIAQKGAVPLIALPTTGGTGSEATDATVITNTDTNVKMMIKQQAFMPRTAIVDPVLTKSTPKHITAATGIDALTHALEAYISKKHIRLPMDWRYRQWSGFSTIYCPPIKTATI